MKSNHRRLVSTAGLVAGALLAGMALAACGNSDDGPILSDEEKLKQFDQGHAAYGGGAGKAPATAGTKPGP